jgi:hypothetical protein
MICRLTLPRLPPIARPVRIECLPGSALPATLERIGYKPVREPVDGSRILPVAVTQEFVQSSGGALTAAEGSRAVSIVTHSAGISPVEVWSFTLP